MTLTPYIVALMALGAMFVYEICQLVFTKQFTTHEKITIWVFWPFVGLYVGGLVSYYYIKHKREQ